MWGKKSFIKLVPDPDSLKENIFFKNARIISKPLKASKNRSSEGRCLLSEKI